jgi:predicted transcriptional regulator
MAEDTADTLTLTAEIVASYLGGEHHRLTPDQIPELIRSVRAALNESQATSDDPATEAEAPKPDKRAINKSITPDALISFIDGKPYKTLKRHLGRHGMDVKQYRERYGLPHDYPIVAPSYSAMRSEMARKIGLGARGRAAAAPAKPAKSRTKKAAAQ